MTDTSRLEGWIGNDLFDRDGDKIGRIEDVYMDDATGRPEWLAVSTGWFGNHVSFVPLAGAAPRGEEMAVRWTKSEVKDAPHADPDGQLTELEETELYRHYGIDATEAQTGDRAAREASIDERTTDGAMTRSEEELHVGVERVESGRVRLRKYVVTEHKTVNVPVQHEEVRVVREPVSAGSEGAPVGDAEIGEDQHEVVLHEERPVVSTETVPKETVRLETDTVTEQRTAEGDVRKEQLEVEGDPSQGR